MKWRITIVCLFLHIGLFSQSGIQFIESVSIENALALAKQSNKNVFIDTYADWCIPCKKMEIEFLNSEVSAFFNQNYVNIRINMDNSQRAPEYRKEYDIVFLPTMIILDSDGNVKYKTDKIMPGRELMAIASKSLNPNVFFESDASKIESSPVVNKSSDKSTKKIGPEKVSFSGNNNPDFLFKEAYFRIELMDGSHKQVVKKYLESQKDWSTPKNIRFIFDFLENTRSKEFAFFAKNLDQFKKELGDENVDLTLNFLINDRLEFGFPRPNIEETVQLFKLTDSIHYKKNAYQYFLQRLLDECKYEKHRKLSMEYLAKIDPNDHALIYSMAEESIIAEEEEETDPDKIKSDIEWVKKAIEINNSLQQYHFGLVDLYIKLGKEKSAKKALKKAIKIAKANKQDTETLKAYLNRI